PQAASETVYKVLASAVANAENNERLDPDSLLVPAAFVDGGPTLKRFRPRAQGRAYRIRKRTCHITIEVESVVAATPGRRAAKGAPAPGKKATKATEATAAEVEVEETDTTEAPAKKTAKAAAKKAPAKKAAADKAEQDNDKPAKKASTKKAAKAAPAAEEGAE